MSFWRSDFRLQQNSRLFSLPLARPKITKLEFQVCNQACCRRSLPRAQRTCALGRRHLPTQSQHDFFVFQGRRTCAQLIEEVSGSGFYVSLAAQQMCKTVIPSACWRWLLLHHPQGGCTSGRLDQAFSILPIQGGCTSSRHWDRFFISASGVRSDRQHFNCCYIGCRTAYPWLCQPMLSELPQHKNADCPTTPWNWKDNARKALLVRVRLVK